MSHTTTISDSIASHIQPIDPHLYKLVQLIPYLGVATRKIILDICQTSRVLAEMVTWNDGLIRIIRDLSLRSQAVISKMDLAGILEHVSQRPVYRSFIAMVVRNEALDKLSGAEEVIREGFRKEFEAGQTERSEELRISYQVLDPENYHPAPYSIYYPIAPWFARYAKTLVLRFTTKIERLGVLFPQVQRRKNMSRDTCHNLYTAGYEGDRHWTQFRTLDLELHKMQTGQEIQGNCEMRMAWKFNELKPRFYYCTGGSSYWRSRHVKRIAVALMEVLESSKLKRRQNPQDTAYFFDDDDWIMLWDLSAFTSSLSELKMFLYYIIRGLEDHLRIQQHPLEILDYQLGVINVTADKLLEVYNEGENVLAPFSIWRAIGCLYDAGMEQEIFTQKNSGMLGVHGNIGFSTAFHAFHAEAAIRENSGCVVGDDALGAVQEDPRNSLIPHMCLIGNIAEEKADILPPLPDNQVAQVSKFIKRRFSRTHHGIVIGLLHAFPGFASAFGIQDQYHTMLQEPVDKVIAKFCAQVGSYLWDLHMEAEIETDEEFDLIRNLLEVVYRRFKISPSGSLPGRKHKDFAEGLPFCVPPLYFNYTLHDWAEYLWDNSQESWALLPVLIGPVLIPPHQPGLVFVANEGGMLNVLEDIGCIHKERVITEWVEVVFTNKRVFRSYLEGQKRSYQCRYLDFVPPWFDRVFSSYSTVPTAYGM